MAGLEIVESDCCTTELQTSCCEPSEKEACCTSEASSCGCSGTQTAERKQVGETVRERYAAAAVALADSSDASCVCSVDLEDKHGRGVFGASLYESGPTSESGERAVTASLGCGVPTAVADLQEGETVLDLGSGAGADVLISARRVGRTGRVTDCTQRRMPHW